MCGAEAKLRRDGTTLDDDVVSGWWTGANRAAAVVESVGLQLIESGAKSGRRWSLRASCLTELQDHAKLAIRPSPFPMAGFHTKDGLCRRRQNEDKDSTYDDNASCALITGGTYVLCPGV
ncbi:hypothetical protein P3342_003471 [Pyrenophora teres f. teres]|nr:hypothetical protein P3342_003471 [Pyrenophora teres f. teres]